MSTTKRAAAKESAPKKRAGRPAAKKVTKKQAAKKTEQKVTKKKTAAKKTVKKTATKTSPRKTAAKRAAKQPGGRPLTQAKRGEAFWARNGEIINDLLELRDALARMDDAVFAYHVSKEKNDFAAWVEAVLGDTECAAALRRARKPGTARGVVVKHLKFYSY